MYKGYSIFDSSERLSKIIRCALLTAISNSGSDDLESIKELDISYICNGLL